ncbi:hypothetical protein RRG08_005049 [Elysia crispata]|uniref:Uncharacterized protein n=1 Tax=Elysia crispata TaxID=231223 RepID=A0AAE1CPD9_9GAST|nr:hypothetical protein RRG08_005049 [Elysia crispata]
MNSGSMKLSQVDYQTQPLRDQKCGVRIPYEHSFNALVGSALSTDNAPHFTVHMARDLLYILIPSDMFGLLEGDRISLLTHGSKVIENMKLDYGQGSYRREWPRYDSVGLA